MQTFYFNLNFINVHLWDNLIEDYCLFEHRALTDVYTAETKEVQLQENKNITYNMALGAFPRSKILGICEDLAS